MTIEQIWKKIIRREPYTLWDIPAFLLWLLSFAYRLGYFIHRRSASTKIQVTVPVISVGNLTVGGAGKTPLVGMMASHLIRNGYRVGIVSSGYGRSGESPLMEPGYRLRKMSAREIGDEVHLLAENIPAAIFSVDRSKSIAARRLALSEQVDLILVDDGFQHHTLARDIDIVAYDAGVTKRALKWFPYGILREPLAALGRADVIIVTRSRFAKDITRLLKRLKDFNPKAMLYSAQFVPSELIGRDRRLPVKYLEDKSVFLFAGIGNFRSFKRQVAALAGHIDFWLELSDHQVYDLQLLEKIRRLARHHHSDILLTTAKDWGKLAAFDFGREIYYLDIQVDLDPGEEKLIEYFERHLSLRTQER